MKKNDSILIIVVAAYSYLFYQQSAGINFLLFTLLIIGLQWYKNPFIVKSYSCIATIIGSLFSSFFITLYGDNGFAIFANIISLSGFAAFSLNPQSSLIIAGFHSFYSYISAVPFMVLDYIERKKANLEGKSSIQIKLLIIGIPLIITYIFFMMYRSANPVFYDLTKNINLNGINWDWVGFTLFGFILLYGFFYQRSLPVVVYYDITASDYLKEENLHNYKQTTIGKILSIDNELLSGIILFSLLNLLLLSLNIVDVSFLSGGLTLPYGITYSDFVHQGTETIIFSVISAILIILFFFRGHLNFSARNSTLKILAYIWVVQNIFMIFSTGMKNHLYIEAYSLTYDRIGVYVFLLLTVIGLVTTFVKVYSIKTNMFLFRKNAWAFYTVLILSVSINWDLLITKYNYNHSKELDTEYLIDLGYSNIPILLNIFPSEMPDELYNKIQYFKSNYEETGWQSWSYNKYKVYSEIQGVTQKN